MISKKKSNVRKLNTTSRNYHDIVDSQFENQLGLVNSDSSDMNIFCGHHQGLKSCSPNHDHPDPTAMVDSCSLLDKNRSKII